MIIHSIFAPSTLSNIYMINNNKKELIIIDPAEVSEEMIRYIEENDLTLKGVLLTHFSKDSVLSLLTLEKIYTFPFYSYFRPNEKRTIPIEPNKEFLIGDIRIHPIEIKGCRDDSLVYMIENALFTGSILYAGNIGETDSYMKREILKKEIKEKLMSLDDNVLLFPAHGPTSKIRIEKLFNIDLVTSEAAYL